MNISHAELLERFNYNSETGEFFHKVSVRRVRAGDLAGLFIGRYRFLKVRSRIFPASRVAWFYIHGVYPNQEIDHINMDPADNRISNLRLSTRSQQMCNRGPNCTNKSGYKGVFYDKKRGLFSASVTINKKCKWLGYFKSAECAAIAYNEAATLLQGEFARPSILGPALCQ